MSTSRSDSGSGDSGGGQKPPEKPPAAPTPGGGVGVSALFARAVAAQKEKAAPDQTVAAGVAIMTCKQCGAPRQHEELVCRFCKEKL
ncbi:MAG: hypothetical protein IPG50_14375 [Myxococcales bacterium]|nr:hypothetical protein [Myxococcales bacterium]